MPKSRIHILSTKKLLSSIIEQARNKDIDIIEKEFISINPILTKEKLEQVMPVISDKKIPYVVFTSANAVDAVKNYLHHGDTWYVPNWNVFCLSGKTKDSLHPHISPKNIIGIAENSSKLAQKIIEYEIKGIIFFCGNKRRNELPDILKKAGVKVHEIVVYETIETPDITTENLDGILFFSPSAVKSFFSVNQLNKKIICFAIGKTTADAIKEYTDNKIIISESPTQEMMLATINFYYQNFNCYK
ncbi:MAG: uroporphyrinogen-III synthase [Bacteroidota bacterium]|nr:uroporphyrinogen-III synthase [Bacteroidota bacterium]